MKSKAKLILLVIVLSVLSGLWFWWTYSGGVSHHEIYDRVKQESTAIQEKVDARADALERKLERLEGKLDRLLKVAEQTSLPDGMAPARKIGK